MAKPTTNAPEFTVGELAGALKRTIEESFGFVRLRGEISNYRGPHSSGHAYFSLKDETARIDAVIWKGTLARLKVKPEEGLEVIASGKVTAYPSKSSYQIVIENLEPAGLGALMALLEERRRKLAAEGLFDEARKQLIPFLPAMIGVVTSPTGAVIRDILHRIADRFPRPVLVWPVRVQGESCAAEVAAAIEGFNAMPEPRPDVLIVARGGGSLEDLWGFNEEIVVRAAAASLIPLISAIGHETDWTLLDHVADLRAPTPTGAAEKAVPVRSELLAALADLSRRHANAALRFLTQRRADWRALARALPRGDALLAIPRQDHDQTSARLANVMAGALDRRHIALARLAHRLASQSPQAKMGRAAQKLEALEHRLRQALALTAERRAAAARPCAFASRHAPSPGGRGSKRTRPRRRASAWRDWRRACAAPSPPDLSGRARSWPRRASFSARSAIGKCWRAASLWSAMPTGSRCTAPPMSRKARGSISNSLTAIAARPPTRTRRKPPRPRPRAHGPSRHKARCFEPAGALR